MHYLQLHYNDSHPWSAYPTMDPDYPVNCSEHGGVEWIWHTFKQCVVGPKEYTGFILGLVSILCWIVVSLPQLYKGWKNGNADTALSLPFLLLWLFGDTANLVGCVLTGQLPIQLYTAIYYVFMDCLMITQWFYCLLKNRRRNRSLRLTVPGGDDVSINGAVLSCCLLLSLNGLVFSMSPWQRDVSMATVKHSSGRSLLSHPIFPDVESDVGYAIGIVSSVLYLGSRMPQIYKNWKRKSTEGLSIWMFSLAILGNLLYGLNILLQGTQGYFIIRHLPWLIGSLGTMTFDSTLFLQFFVYGAEDEEKNSEDTDPILQSADGTVLV
ncbi:PREDICTED: lysosomal amino acid transporter 1 homolog isoform X3 [Branchiostoma belcheri]|uniref:Lysosomal amino acid transporter 1 homolog isoform X1 n=1 Tax=Branchiostoma belcheri TaxID=7741 RepID=A0A6P5AVI1_BRABE|nr:PREDICTED: lysosomal amino acid transporter 1 homolog isoform X1 [Branchiostoma belcheri]XP_019647092.1 PREDICTED: lysosomal amino acid transporter 1 homolog isoform X2 [Branchiostoma belcheri]XP_019647093.1 PREDICTED: lysosomal amino acid transporter 1 homolog isoform X3 [Branchiostoma belcheri]